MTVKSAPDMQKIIDEVLGLEDIIKKIQIKAIDDSFEQFMKFHQYRWFKDIVLVWGRNYMPDICYLCGEFFASRPQHWYFDAQGNIVHEMCGRGGFHENQMG